MTIEITPEDMAEALQKNPLAMEQAKVASLQRENAALKAVISQLTSNHKEPEEVIPPDAQMANAHELN